MGKYLLSTDDHVAQLYKIVLFTFKVYVEQKGRKKFNVLKKKFINTKQALLYALPYPYTTRRCYIL